MMRTGKKLIFALLFGWMLAFALTACKDGNVSGESGGQEQVLSGEEPDAAAGVLSGRLKRVTANGGYVEYHYDDAGNLCLVENYDEKENCLQTFTKYAYDEKGNLLTERAYRFRQNQGREDEKLSEVLYTYTRAGTLRSVLSRDYQECRYTLEEYKYSPAGDLACRSETEGMLELVGDSGDFYEKQLSRIEYHYDSRGKVTETRQSDFYGDGYWLYSYYLETFAYDNLGNLMWHTTSNNEKEEYVYDRASGGCLTCKKRYGDREPYEVTEYVNDAAGRPLSSRRLNHFSYDRTSYQETRCSYFYDSMGLLIAVLEDGNDQEGRPVGFSLGGGVCSEFGMFSNVAEKQYDEQGRLTKVVSGSRLDGGAGCEILYDGQGRLSIYADERYGGNIYEFLYDEKGRLIAVTRQSNEKNTICWRRIYDEGDNLTEYVLVPPGTTDICTYDGEGNLIKRENERVLTTWRHEYDEAGRMLSSEQRDDFGEGVQQVSLTTYEYYN